MQSRFPDAPAAIAALKVEARGFPVPWFVPWYDGEPEFRAVDARRIAHAHRKGLCWVCGRPLPGAKAFTIGPMCAVNRVSSEPPAHLACARFAVTACPFLSRPMAKRRDVSDIPHQAPPGLMIERNPGVSLIWLARSYRTQREGDGILFRLDPPVSVEWWCEGRTATRAEILESISSGLPRLREVAESLDGPEGVALLDRNLGRAMALVPP